MVYGANAASALSAKVWYVGIEVALFDKEFECRCKDTVARRMSSECSFFMRFRLT
jgi:hypothetical protein